MPCALSSMMIMSTEYDKDGNNNTSTLSRSSSSCEDLSDDQTKINSNPNSPSMSPSSPISVCNEPTGDKTVPTKHSFSIDALVGNNKSAESVASKFETTDQEKSNSVWNNPLVDLKRIQSYYQHLYSSQNGAIPLKHLGNYIYPPQLGANFENGSRFAELAQSDQLLAYYTNLYLQNSSSFYQERYIEPRKSYSTNSLESKPNGYSQVDKESYESHPPRKSNHDRNDKLALVSSKDRNDKIDVDQNSHKDRQVRSTKDKTSQELEQTQSFRDNQILDLHRQRPSPPSESNSYRYSSSPVSEQPPQPSKSSLPQSSSQLSSLYGTSSAGLEKPVDLVINNAQQPQQSTGLSRPSPAYSNQHVLYGLQHPVDQSSPLNSPNFYPPYCDYNLLLKHNKSSHLLGAGSEDNALGNGTGGGPGGAGCNASANQQTSLHSPLTPNSDTNGSTSAAAAAAAAYHLSNMFRKPKRIRTAFSPGQLLRLEEIFEKNRYVVGCERKQLARDLNLSETQIKVWFQNRRTKHKREKHVGGGSGGGSSAHSGHHQSLHHSFQQHQSHHPMHQQSGQHRHLGSTEDPKKYLHSTMRPSLITSSASSSLPSASSAAAYLSSTASFQLASSSASSIYSSNVFKASQTNAHRTLVAK